ncbi:hypothetical protein HZA86_05490 [Candidatus Uhrbacteria bacterium]|nr:hypothetical protein [Candidatus Uhrbacteria bacterium]
MSKKSFIAGSALGALVASAVVLMLPDKTNKKLRKDTAEYAKELSDRIATEYPKLKKRSKKAYEALVDQLMVEYKKNKKIANTKLAELSSALKDQWEEMNKR